MADIRLKDRNGNPVDFYGAEYLDMVTPEGTEVPYALYDPETLIPENIAEGVVIGNVTGTKADITTSDLSVDLDFSGGDMEITPEAGAAFSKVNISQPETLLPENIAEGVDIAGIIGTLAGGGGNIKVAMGVTTSWNDSTVTITHGLGVVPDFIFTVCPYGNRTNNNVNLCAFGVNKAFLEKHPEWEIYNLAIRYYSSKYVLDSYSSNPTIEDNTAFIRNANEENFSLAGSYSGNRIPTGTMWLAISGLT